MTYWDYLYYSGLHDLLQFAVAVIACILISAYFVVSDWYRKKRDSWMYEIEEEE